MKKPKVYIDTTEEKIMKYWRIKDNVSVEELTKHGFQLRGRYYMRKIDPSLLPETARIYTNFVYIGNEQSVFPGMVSMLHHQEDPTPYIQDLITIGIVELTEIEEVAAKQ